MSFPPISYPNASEEGEVQRQKVLFIPNPIVTKETIDLGENPFERCGKKVCPVYATLSDTIDFHNDFSTPNYHFPVIYTVALSLEKCNEATGSWANVANLTDDTYGTYYNDSPIVNNVRVIAYQIEWRTVLSAHGVGDYRVKFDYGVGAVYSEEYCLKQYTKEVVDGSTRITYTLNDVIGDPVQTHRRNYAGLNLPCQVRICDSQFGFTTNNFTTEETRLNSGKQVSWKKDMDEDYKLEIYSASVEMHDLLRYTVLMANDIVIDDYNRGNNLGSLAGISVEVSGGYEPNTASSYNPSVVIEFKDKYRNRIKKGE